MTTLCTYGHDSSLSNVSQTEARRSPGPFQTHRVISYQIVISHKQSDQNQVQFISFLQNMLGSEAREQNKVWLMQQVNHILEPLMLSMVRAQPDNHVKYMVDYLEKEFGERALNGDQAHAAMLKAQIAELEEKLAAQNQGATSASSKEKEGPQGSEDETDSDDEDDYCDALPVPVANKFKGPRASVSAEAFGVWNQKGSFKPKVIPKAQAAKDAIKEKLNMAFMFSALDEKEKDIVIDAMEEKKVEMNEVVIQENTQGDCLYVVGSGTLFCTKIFPGNTDPTFLKTYQPGEAFGELALLYNAPRAATITANETCVLWKLDRDTFNHIVKDAAQRRREKYESFLESVSIFETMEPYERSKLADAFVEHRFKKDDLIIKEGQAGNDLFLLQEGTAIATKTIMPGQPPQKVMDYKQGDFFGERALLKSEPRAANVVATSDCIMVSMDRHSVKRLLGPLEELLKRNFEIYEKYTKSQ